MRRTERIKKIKEERREDTKFYMKIATFIMLVTKYLRDMF